MGSKFKRNGIVNVSKKPIYNSIGGNTDISGYLLTEFYTLKMEPYCHNNLKFYNITKITHIN